MWCSWGLGLCHRFPLRSFITAEDAHSANPIAGFSYRGLSLLKSESGSEHRRFQNLEVLLSFLVGSPGPALLFPHQTHQSAVWLCHCNLGCVAFNKLLHLSVGCCEEKKERKKHAQTSSLSTVLGTQDAHRQNIGYGNAPLLVILNAVASPCFGTIAWLWWGSRELEPGSL